MIWWYDQFDFLSSCRPLRGTSAGQLHEISHIEQIYWYMSISEWFLVIITLFAIQSCKCYQDDSVLEFVTDTRVKQDKYVRVRQLTGLNTLCKWSCVKVGDVGRVYTAFSCRYHGQKTNKNVTTCFPKHHTAVNFSYDPAKHNLQWYITPNSLLPSLVLTEACRLEKSHGCHLCRHHHAPTFFATSSCVFETFYEVGRWGGVSALSDKPRWLEVWGRDSREIPNIKPSASCRLHRQLNKLQHHRAPLLWDDSKATVYNSS